MNEKRWAEDLAGDAGTTVENLSNALDRVSSAYPGARVHRRADGRIGLTDASGQQSLGFLEIPGMPDGGTNG